MSKVSTESITKELLVTTVEFKDLTVKLSTLGAGIFDIKYVDDKGNKESVVAHPIDPKDFINNSCCHGKTCGRVAGRINNGSFVLDDKLYNLDLNNGSCSLHGGFSGVSEIYFKLIETIETIDRVSVKYKGIAKDKESGYPGNLSIYVIYIITNNTIEINFIANTDKKTLCNLTNHTYFNLSGNCKKDVLDQKLYLNSSKYTNLNNDLIAKSIDKVNKIFDFRVSKKIGEDIFNDSLKTHPSFGYDHCFLLDNVDLNNLSASLYDNISKRKMEVYTTYPTIVVYACCYPTDKIISSNKPSTIHDSVCLECQFIPNSINMGSLETVLDVNDTYNHKTIYKFSIE